MPSQSLEELVRSVMDRQERCETDQQEIRSAQKMAANAIAVLDSAQFATSRWTSLASVIESQARTVEALTAGYQKLQWDNWKMRGQLRALRARRKRHA